MRADTPRLSRDEERQLFLAQYAAIRSEILLLMDANEKRVFAGLGVATTMTGVLATLVSTRYIVPGVIFLFPGLILFLSLNIHYFYAARTAGMSSFLAHATDVFGRSPVNWDRDVAAFARDVGAHLSSGLSVAGIYGAIGAISVAFGLASTASRVYEPSGVSILVLVDLGATFLFAACLGVAYLRLVRRRRAFVELRDTYDRYWGKTFGQGRGTSDDAFRPPAHG